LLFSTSSEAAISAHSEVTFFGASEAASQAQSSLGSRQLGAIGSRSDQLGFVRIGSLQLGALEVASSAQSFGSRRLGAQSFGSRHCLLAHSVSQSPHVTGACHVT